jgi:TolB-like protein
VGTAPEANLEEKWPGVDRRRQTEKPRAAWRLWMWAALAVLALAAIAVGVKWMRGREAARNTAPRMNGRVMLAVLPFENLTGDATQEYFSDGLTEEMIAQLGRLDAQHVGVIARTSVMHYKQDHAQLEKIGRELGVQYVLEGSVRRDAGKVRVSAQLIQMKDQTHVWAKQYDRELSNLLVLQGEIAQEIAGEIQIALGTPRQSNVPVALPLSPAEFEAHDLYLKGLYFWNKRTVDGFKQAIDYYQQAIGKDPKNARAYAGLADCYSLIGGYSGIQKPEYAEKARAAARRALEIDDNLPEAHTAWALIIQNYDWDWKTAEHEFRRAIELNPNYATAHHWYAEHLSWRGRFDEALQESELARQLDPLSLIIAADRGAILYFARRYDQAIKQFQSVMDLDPNYPRTGLIRAAYIQKGMYAEALGLLEKVTPKDEDAAGYGYWWGERAYIYGCAGRQGEAQHALEKVWEANQRQQMDVEGLLKAYIAVGNKDKALKWLKWAVTHQPNALMSLKVDPVYDTLRSDPRFQELLHRVGLTR